MKAAALSIAVLLALAITLPGVAFLTGSALAARKADWVNVGSHASLPDDGTPELVIVRVTRTDAWTRLPDEVIGRVWLRRVPDTAEVVALHHYHLRSGAGVVFDDAKRVFRSQCWDLEFDLDGKPLQASRPNDGMGPIEAKMVAGEVFARRPAGKCWAARR